MELMVLNHSFFAYDFQDMSNLILIFDLKDLTIRAIRYFGNGTIWIAFEDLV